MTVEKWPVALDANDVLVMTPQSLVNMLKVGVDFTRICLLVGHCTFILLFFGPRQVMSWLCSKLYQPVCQA